MFQSLCNSMKTKIFIIIILLCLFVAKQGYAHICVPNELNIKISSEVVKEGNVGAYVSFLANELEEDLKYLDKKLKVIILKSFLEDDPESHLTLWYKIRFIAEVTLDLDDIKKMLLEYDTSIVTVEMEFIVNTKSIPNDPAISKMTYDYYALIGAYDAWDIEQGSEEVVVAVIDSGIDTNHPDLANRFVNSSLFKRYPPYSSIDPGNPSNECNLTQGKMYCYDIYVDSAELDNGVLPPEYDVRDILHHGTPMAGIIAANHNTIGMPGICPNCKLLPLKVNYLQNMEEQTGQLNPQTKGYVGTGTIASGIEYAAKNGADIINISLAGSQKSDILEDAVNEAYKKYNCILIASANNEDEDGESYPAAYNNVIGVTAVKADTSGMIVRRDKAQYGTWIDIVAPGEKIVSIVPNSNDFKAYSGTSVATPFVSGLAALVRSIDQNFTIHNFRQLLKESSIRIDDPLYDGKKLGYGLVNLKMALEKLDDHLWDYSSTTQQGYTSTGNSSGGSSSSPFNIFSLTPYIYGFSSNPFWAFTRFGLPVSNGFPAAFTPYSQQQTLMYGSFGLSGGQLTQGFLRPQQLQQPFFYKSYGLTGGQLMQGSQRPYNSFSSGYPFQIGQGFTLPSSNYGYTGQFSPFFQQSFPMSNYAILSPFIGKFSSSSLGVFNFI